MSETHIATKRTGGVAIGSILIAVIIAAVSFMWLNTTKLSDFEKDFQAVFLTNGQVYFGHVMSQNNAQITVEDIYYLQVTQPLQQQEQGEAAAAPATNQQGELSLVKLGNELHGPTDKMYINRDHVLFVEDLKDDSNVVQAITNYKSGGQ